MSAPSTERAQAAALLGVKDDADAADIHAAFRRAARETHPDLGGSTAEFARVHDAFELLLIEREDQDVADEAVQEQKRAAASFAEVAKMALPAVVAWRLAWMGTGAALAVAMVVLMVAPAGVVTVVLCGYLGGWVAFTWWHAAGRPAPARTALWLAREAWRRLR